MKTTHPISSAVHSLWVPLLLTGAASAQSTWLVDQSATNCPGNGQSGSPFCSINEAIAAPNVVDGDTVIVLPGTYSENVDLLTKNITLSGTSGFTIIDPTLADPSLPAVSFTGGQDQSCVLENFIIQNGAAYMGAGIYCEDSGPLIQDCVVQDNDAGGLGGGIFSWNDNQAMDLLVRRTLFLGNTAVSSGGGALLYTDQTGGGPTIVNASVFEDCDFVKNDAGNGAGGAIGLIGQIESPDGSIDPLFLRCVLDDNDATAGAGIFIQTSPKGTFDSCVISSNKAVQVGGGMYLEGARGTTFKDTTITDNKSDYEGAGAYIANGFEYQIFENCLISKNVSGRATSQGAGGGIYLASASIDLRNSTVAGNACIGGAAGVHVNSDNGLAVLVTDSVLWANRAVSFNPGAGGTKDFYYPNPATNGSVTFSCVRNASSANPWFDATSSIALNPQFVAGYACPLAPDADYFLVQSGAGASPCLDAGSTTALGSAVDGRVTDPAGLLDIGLVDMGFHYPTPSCP